jgi:uncharacterized Zn finger protein
MYGDFRPYVSAAERKRLAAQHATKLKKTGRSLAPIVVTGRAISTSYWGNAWCANLEQYSDYASRLPRGRTYVRNGSVFDLQIMPGRVTALVSGSEIYEIAIDISPLSKKRWRSLVDECSGQIGSLVELLRGKLAQGVMEVLARPRTGLFPAPRDISLSCSCPDWASMCKHVAAALYGVAVRLDTEPSLFFTLCRVDERELVERAAATHAFDDGAKDRIAVDELESLFDIELEPPGKAPRSETKPKTKPKAKAKTTRGAKKTRRPAAKKKPTVRDRPARRSPGVDWRA